MPRHSRFLRSAVTDFLIILGGSVLLLFAVADKNLANRVVAGNENGAILTIRTLHAEEARYFARFGEYATSLTQLGSQAAGAIPKDLAEGHRSGYLWTLAGSPEGYTVSAVPEVFGKTGTRTFFSDQTMVIRNNFSEKPATANSPAIGVPAAPGPAITPQPRE